MYHLETYCNDAGIEEMRQSLGKYKLAQLEANTVNKLGKVKLSSDNNNAEFSNILKRFINIQRWSPKLKIGELNNEWSILVGEVGARYSKVIKFEELTLFVEVDGDKFMFMFLQMKNDIMARVSEFLETEVLDIEFIKK
jgi:predicted nucleic acid-binding Zn ribbon protein